VKQRYDRLVCRDTTRASVGPHTDYTVINGRQDGFVSPEMLILNTDARSTCSRNKHRYSEFPEITLLAHHAVCHTGKSLRSPTHADVHVMAVAGCR